MNISTYMIRYTCVAMLASPVHAGRRWRAVIGAAGWFGWTR